jgi:hypothetical protein
MSDEPVLSQDDAEVAAFFRRMGSWRTDPVLYALHEVRAAGESEGRKEERARIRALVRGLRDDLARAYEQPYEQRLFDVTKEEIETLEEVLTLIDKEDTSHE